MRLGCVLAVGKRAFTCDMWRKVASRSSPESSKINEWNLDSSSHESIKSCGKRHSKRAGILLLFLLLFSEDFSENSLTLSSIRSGKRHSTRACWLNTVDKATLNFGRIALFKLITIYANLNFIHSFYTPQSGFMWLESRPLFLWKWNKNCESSFWCCSTLHCHGLSDNKRETNLCSLARLVYRETYN